MPINASNLKSDDWRSSIPALACGVMSPYEGKQLFARASAEMSTEAGEWLHRALRSMIVLMISKKTSSWTMTEWAIELKPLIAAMKKSFPVIADRILSLRCMLLEASEITDINETELPQRPGVTELVRLLEAAGEPLAAAEIASRLETNAHTTAERIRIAVAAGSVSPDYEDWQRVRFFSSAASAP